MRIVIRMGPVSDDEVFSPEAALSVVGQTVRFNNDTAKVIDSRFDGGDVYLTLELGDQAAAVIAALTASGSIAV